MNKEKRPRTKRVCIQTVIDEIDLLYSKMKNEVKIIQIERNIKYNEAFKIWKRKNINIDTEIFK